MQRVEINDAAQYENKPREQRIKFRKEKGVAKTTTPACGRKATEEDRSMQE